jgi:hypothetical protein
VNKFLIVIVSVLWALPVTAQDDASDSRDTGPELLDKDRQGANQNGGLFSISAGATLLDADGRFHAKLSGGQDVTIIDFDRAGLKETDSSYWLTLTWRFADSRWGGWFGSWEYDVTGARQWEDELVIPGEETIPVGAYVTSEFDAAWYIVEATYSFHRSETVDAGIGFGLHTVDLKTTLTAQIQADDDTAELVREKLNTLAPLPNLLAYVHWEFAPRWRLLARYGWFGMDYKKHSGRMTNAHAMLDYKLSPNWSLGMGYQFVDLELKTQKKDYLKIYDIEFSGPMAYARAIF